MAAEIKEPKYIPVYHAIDWLSGLVDAPMPIFMHEKIASKEDISQPDYTCLIDVNTYIKSGELNVLSSPKVMGHFLIEFLGLVVSYLRPDAGGHDYIVLAID